MTNDKLTVIDALLSRGESLPYDLAKTLREQHAQNAIRACVRDKRIADLERELSKAKEKALMYDAIEKMLK